MKKTRETKTVPEVEADYINSGLEALAKKVSFTNKLVKISSSILISLYLLLCLLCVCVMIKYVTPKLFINIYSIGVFFGLTMLFRLSDKQESRILVHGVSSVITFITSVLLFETIANYILVFLGHIDVFTLTQANIISGYVYSADILIVAILFSFIYLIFDIVIFIFSTKNEMTMQALVKTALMKNDMVSILLSQCNYSIIKINSKGDIKPNIFLFMMMRAIYSCHTKYPQLEIDRAFTSALLYLSENHKDERIIEYIFEIVQVQLKRESFARKNFTATLRINCQALLDCIGYTLSENKDRYMKPKPEFGNIPFMRRVEQYNKIIKKYKCSVVTDFAAPVTVDNNSILINTASFLQWKERNPFEKMFELIKIIPLKEKEPVFSIFEDGVKTQSFCLETEDDEDFTGKNFSISVRLNITKDPSIIPLQIDGFVSDSAEPHKMTGEDIGYRLEGSLLSYGGEEAKRIHESLRHGDLEAKGLKFQGVGIPINVRLIGICSECGKSFAFHAYSIYMIQRDVAYSDDGLDACSIPFPIEDKKTWSYEKDGKTFRYYNSFNCPHCGCAYIDYGKYPEIKKLGVCECVLLDREPYTAE